MKLRKYKVEFEMIEKFIVDVRAENQEKAEKIAEDKWNNENYQVTGDIDTVIGSVYDVTDTDDPFDEN